MSNPSIFCKENRSKIKKKKGGGGVGDTPKTLWQGCVSPVRIPLARENLTKNIPLAKDHFLIKSPILYSLGKTDFPKTYGNLAPKRQFWGVLVKKNIPLAKDSGLKSDHWERHIPSKVSTPIATSWFAMEF